MRLIDADKLDGARRMAIRAYENANIFDPEAMRENIKPLLDIIVDTPTIDPDDLVKHGEWIPEKFSNGYSEFTNYWCSVCDRKLIGYSDPKDAPYCHCGAKMDGGK